MWRSTALLIIFGLVAACPLLTRRPDEQSWTLTTGVVGSGSVSRSPDTSSYPDGSDVTLTAVPDPDWAFLEWAGDLSGRQNPVTLTVTADMSVTATFYELVSRLPSVATCQLAGTPNSGELWTVHFGGSEYPYTVADSDTLPVVALGLALLLDGLDDVTAGVEDSLIACVDLTGEPMDIRLSVSSPASATVDGTTALVKLVHLGGSAVPGQSWSIQVDGVAFSCTVVDGDTMQDVAVALAIAIDAAADYLGHAEGTTVVVTRVLGGSFSLTATPPGGGSATVDESTATTKSVVLSGPYNAGDTWSVALDGFLSSYVVQGGDTGSAVAAALTAGLESVGGFAVGSEGQRIVVTRTSGGLFELAAAVTPSGAGTVDDATATAVAMSPSGPVSPGDNWALTVNAVEYLYTVQAGDSAASVAAAIAALVDNAPGYIAAAEGSIFTITRLAGGELSVDLAVAPH